MRISCPCKCYKRGQKVTSLLDISSHSQNQQVGLDLADRHSNVVLYNINPLQLKILAHAEWHEAKGHKFG